MKYPYGALGLCASLFILPFAPTFIPASAILLGGYYLHDLLPIIITTLLLFYSAIKLDHLYLKSNQLFIGLFIAILLLQTTWQSDYLSFNYLTAISLSSAIIAAILCDAIPLKRQQLMQLIAASLVMAGYMQIIIVILQYYAISLTIPLKIYNYTFGVQGYDLYNFLARAGTRISGSIYQPNLFTNFMCCALMANLSLKINSTRYHWSLWLTTSLLFSVGATLSESRLILIYAFAIVAYALYLWLKQQRKIAWWTLVCGLSLILATGWHAQSSKAKQSYLTSGLVSAGHFITQQSIQSTSDQQRQIMWRQAWRLYKAHPLIGNGWYHYSQGLMQLQEHKHSQTQLNELRLPMNCHNLFIQLLADTGLLGCLLVGTWFIYCAYRLWQAPTQLQILPLAIFLIQLIHSMVEFPLFYNPFLFMLIIMVNLVDKPQITLQRRQFRLTATLISLIAAWQISLSLRNFLILAQYYRPALISENNIYATINYKYQIGINPLWEYYADLDLANKITINQIVQDNQEIVAVVYTALSKVCKFTPFPTFVIKLAILEQLLGHNQQAQTLIEQTLKLFPLHKSELQNYAKMYCAKNSQVCTAINAYFTR